MTDMEWITLAESEGFSAAFLPAEQIPVNPGFRAFCEENRCGRYGANYACPPDCGTAGEMHRRLLAGRRAMVLASHWEIDGYGDLEGICCAEDAHNAGTLRLLDAARQSGLQGFAVGCSGCRLCSPCRRVENAPCPFPERRMSCMSAYCVDVAALSRRCGLEYGWGGSCLHLFGMIVFLES